MKFKVGDKVRRKVEHMSVWWREITASHHLNQGDIFTIATINEEGDIIRLKEIPNHLSFTAGRFELVPTVNKRFAKELEE